MDEYIYDVKTLGFTKEGNSDGILCRDDYSYMIDQLMHQRHVLSAQDHTDNVYLIEVSKTLVTAMKLVDRNVPEFNVANPKLTIEPSKDRATFEATLVDADADWRVTKLATCTISFDKDSCAGKYHVTIKRKYDDKVLKLNYSVFERNIIAHNEPEYSMLIYSYDMNFPAPSELSSRIAGFLGY